MKKLLSIILTATVILSAIVVSIPSTAAASDDTLTINPSIWRQTATISHIYVPYDTSYDPVNVKVGDVIEISVDMKSKDPEITGTTGIDIKTFFSGGNLNHTRNNDGTLTYTDTYYDYNAIANVPTLSSTITAPDQWDEPDPTRSHFGYTDSTPYGVGDWSDWKNLYNFTLSVNKSGTTDISTYVIDVNSQKGFGRDAIDIYDTTLFDYRMSIKVVAHNDPDVLIGDVDGSGVVDISDATLIQMFIAQAEPLEGDKFYIADVSNDGVVDVTDATQIQMYMANLITQFDRKTI